MIETAYERVLAAAQRLDLTVLATHSGMTAKVQCPAHDDREPSLNVRDGEGMVLLHCFAGCETKDVVERLGLTMADLFDDRREVTYHYPDGRVVHRRPGKEFAQSGNTKGTALYRGDRLPAAIATGATIYVVEGEKDVHAVERAGGVATCSAMGGANWHKADPSPLYGAKHVVVVRDKDETGKRYAARVVDSLAAHVEQLEVVEAHQGKDASDHLDHYGHRLDDFRPVETPTPTRFARITWAHDIEPEPVVWAWRDGLHGRVPASALTLAAGREGTGKSSFGIWAAAQVSRGLLPGSFAGTPRRVLYVATEDSWEQTIVPRLLAAEADLTMVGRFDVIDQGQEVALSLPTDNALLEQMVARHEVALVVVDPLMSAMGKGIDTHVEREVRAALEPLAALARRTGCVLLGIAHFNKGSGTDLNNLITGSGAFKNVARAVLGFAHDDEGGVMSQTKNSLGRGDLPSVGYVLEGHHIETRTGAAETSRFRLTGPVERTVRDVLADSRKDSDDQTDRREAHEWLVDFLSSRTGGAATFAEVVEAGKEHGYSQDVLKRAKRDRVVSRKAGFGHGWKWRLNLDEAAEASTKGAKGAGDTPPPPSLPSVPPSQPTHRPRGVCDRCGRETESPSFIKCTPCTNVVITEARADLRLVNTKE